VLARFEPGVNVKREIVFVKEWSALEELKMPGGQRIPHPLSGTVEIFRACNNERSAGVSLKGFLAACYVSQPQPDALFDKVDQHLLVIAAKAMNALWGTIFQREYPLDYSRRVCSTVDQIAEEDHGVVLLARQSIEQQIELRCPAVYVSDDKRLHKAAGS
jgi:hypothetical protein